MLFLSNGVHNYKRGTYIFQTDFIFLTNFRRFNENFGSFNQMGPGVFFFNSAYSFIDSKIVFTMFWQIFISLLVKIKENIFSVANSILFSTSYISEGFNWDLKTTQNKCRLTTFSWSKGIKIINYFLSMINFFPIIFKVLYWHLERHQKQLKLLFYDVNVYFAKKFYY